MAVVHHQKPVQVCRSRNAIDCVTQLGSDHIHLAGCTASPTGSLAARQARQLTPLLQESQVQDRILPRDLLLST